MKTFQKWFMPVFLAITVVPLIAFFLFFNGRYTVCAQRERIVQVGGCDLFGVCSALGERGTIIYKNKPVVGETVCTRVHGGL